MSIQTILVAWHKQNPICVGPVSSVQNIDGAGFFVYTAYSRQNFVLLSLYNYVGALVLSLILEFYKTKSYMDKEEEEPNNAYIIIQSHRVHCRLIIFGISLYRMPTMSVMVFWRSPKHTIINNGPKT